LKNTLSKRINKITEDDIWLSKEQHLKTQLEKNQIMLEKIVTDRRLNQEVNEKGIRELSIKEQIENVVKWVDEAKKQNPQYPLTAWWNLVIK